MSNGNGQNGNGQGAGGNEDYQYDVFLSYSYKSRVKDWVTEKFNPEFEEWLDSQLIQLESPMLEKGRVCLAKREIKPGDQWPAELQEQLRRSKVLVAVCSPHYVISGWCKSEWETFQNRAPGLAIPALYDGSNDFFKKNFGSVQYQDFRDFREIPGGRVHLFREEVRNFAEFVATKVICAPPFDSAAPSVVLAAAQTPHVFYQSL